MKRVTRKSVLALFMAFVLLIGCFGEYAVTAKAAQDGTGLVKKRTIKRNGEILLDSTVVYENDDLDVRYELNELFPGTNILQGETYEIAVPSNLLIASAMSWDAEIDGNTLCNCYYNNVTHKIELKFADGIFGGAYAGGIQNAYIGFYANVDGSGKSVGDQFVVSGPTGTADDTTLYYGGNSAPTKASIMKTGAFADEPSKLIEWTVTVSEGPDGEHSLVVKDTFSANQQFVEGSFTVDGAAATPTVSGQNLTYTIAITDPMPNKQHVLKYRTVAYAIEQVGGEYNVKEGEPLKMDAVNEASVHAEESGPALDYDDSHISCDFGKVKWLEKQCLNIKTDPLNPANRDMTWQVKVHTENYTFTNVVIHDEIKASVVSGSDLSFVAGSFKMVDDATNTVVPGSAVSGSPAFDSTGKCAWETGVIPTLAPGNYTITYDVKITNYSNYKKNNTEKISNTAWATYDKVTASGTPGFGPGRTPKITVDAGDIATGEASLSKFLPTVHYSYDVSSRGAEVHGLPWMISVNADREILTSDYCLVEVVGGWHRTEEYTNHLPQLPQHVASTTDKTQVIFDVQVDDVNATAEQYAQIQIAPWGGDPSKIQITFGNLLTGGHKVTFRFQTYIDESERDYFEGHNRTDDKCRIAWNDVVLRNSTEELIWKDCSIWAYTQVLKKEFTSYNYDEHLAVWRMEFNRDMMELKNAVITDTLQTGRLDHIEIVKHAPDSYMETDPMASRYTLTDNPAELVYYTYDSASKEFAVHFGDVPQKQTYTLYIYEKIDPTDTVMDGGIEKSLATYNGAINISNSATLTKDGSSPVIAEAEGVINNKLFDKKAQIVSKGKAAYTIYMNQGRMTWPTGAKISDIMSPGLMPDLSSFKMFTANVAADGTMTQALEVGADKYTVAVKVLEAGNPEGAPEKSVKTTISLPSTATNEAYIISYDVYVDPAYAAMSSINFENTVTVDGHKNDGILATETIALSQLMGYGSGTLSYSEVKLLKVNDDGAALMGAAFDLLYDGSVVASDVTDVNGEIIFSNLTPGFTYTLVETSAPAGYLKAANRTFVAPPRGDSSMLDTPIKIVDPLDLDSILISIPVIKKWIGPAAPAAEVQLLANGAPQDSAVLNTGNSWQHTFSDLHKFSSGVEIVYTIVETVIPGYTPSITGSAASGFTVTNTNAAKINIPVTKTWIGLTGAQAEIELKADGAVIDQLTLNAVNSWSGSFVNLPRYDAIDGHEIVYTISEVAIPGYYEPSITGSVATGFTVTNTKIPTPTPDPPAQDDPVPMTAPKTADAPFAMLFSLMVECLAGCFITMYMCKKRRTDK